MKELTRKHKHIAKLRNHLPRKLVGKLKDKSSKIIYIHNKCLKDAQNKICKNDVEDIKHEVKSKNVG